MKKNKIILLLALLLGASAYIEAGERKKIAIKVKIAHPKNDDKKTRYIIKKKEKTHILNLDSSHKNKKPNPFYYYCKKRIDSSLKTQRRFAKAITRHPPRGFSEYQISIIANYLRSEKESKNWSNSLTSMNPKIGTTS